MATGSRIGIEHEGGEVESIYCHWDDYPNNIDNILKPYYQNRGKVEELMELGSISYLGIWIRPLPNEPHSFASPAKDVTVAYHRDRNEHPAKPYYNKSIQEFEVGLNTPYGYVFGLDGKWKTFMGGLK
jgi:hypothetical protein